MKTHKIFFLITISILIAAVIVIFLNCKSVKPASGKPDIKEDALLQYFSKTHPDKRILTYIEGDADGDGTKDLIAIYSVEKNKNRMVVIVDKQGSFECSDEAPAPADNPQLEFKEYDGKPTSQFYLSGSNSTGTILGFALFSLQNMKIVDIFDQGMEECCN